MDGFVVTRTCRLIPSVRPLDKKEVKFVTTKPA
jgi:hypothetical protein